MRPASLTRFRPVGLTLLLFFIAPASTNYGLQEWGFGGGATEQSESTNYRLQGTVNQGEGNQLEGSSYNIGPGEEYALMADVAPAPALTNEERWYNQLKLVIDPGPNPSDTTFAVAISTDGFTTTNYVQSDNTVGATLGSEDWQTYTAWGGATGIIIIGLDPDETYSVKVKSEQGQFTESPWGPIDTAATEPPTLAFDIDTDSTDIETAPPYTIDFGTLNTSGVNSASDYIWVDIDTNGEGGASVYVLGSNAGLNSTVINHTISSITADLSATSEGYGAQVTSVAETSGGPLAADSPFNGSSENVGIIDSGFEPIVTSTLAPIEAGRGQISLKTSISNLTPAATDYSETLTLVAAAIF